MTTTEVIEFALFLGVVIAAICVPRFWTLGALELATDDEMITVLKRRAFDRKMRAKLQNEANVEVDTKIGNNIPY